MRGFGSVFLGALAALAWVAVIVHPDWPLTPLAIMTACAGALTAWSLGLLVRWITADLWPDLDAHAMRVARKEAVTPDSEILDRLSRLTSYQAEVWLKRSAAIVQVPGVAGPTVYHVLDEEWIPAEFIEEFMDASSGDYLKPKRDYSEGSTGRKWADVITEFFVQRGMARPAVGNLPAAWTYGFSQAALWLGLEVEEAEEDDG
jgi:hypothetical protein